MSGYLYANVVCRFSSFELYNYALIFCWFVKKMFDLVSTVDQYSVVRKYQTHFQSVGTVRVTQPKPKISQVASPGLEPKFLTKKKKKATN